MPLARELVKRRFGVEIHARTSNARSKKKTLVSERAPGVGHERFPTERYEELQAQRSG